MPKHGQGKKKKQARNTENPNTSKQAKHSKNPEGYQHQLLAWHFRLMDKGGEWPCNLKIINSILQRLHEYEEKRWSDIVDSPHNHPMPVESIEQKAQRRLCKIGLEDAGTLYQLKIAGNGGKRRLWGIRQENVFQIIWWDPNHSVYITKSRR